MKLRNILTLIIYILLSNNIFAQMRSFSYSGYGYINIGENYYVYADAANVRTAPNLNSEVKFLLYAGQEIKIISINEKNEIIDDLYGAWLFVSTTNGEKREGWIWSNTLSYKQLQQDNIKFVFAIDKQLEDGYNCIVKAVEKGKIIDKLNYKILLNEARSPNAKIIDNVHFTDVKYIVNIYGGGGACGDSTNYFYFAWLDEKKKFVELPKAWSVSGACEGSHIEKIIFPIGYNTVTTFENFLIKITEIITVPDGIDADDCDQSNWPHEYKTSIFKWNGEKIIEIDD